MQRRGRRLAEVTLRGLLLIGGVVGAWAVCNAIATDAAYANDKPQPSVVGELLDTAGGVVDAVLAPSSPSSDEQTTTWQSQPAGSDDTRSAQTEKATTAEPGQRVSQPRPIRTAPSATATEPSALSASTRQAINESTGGLVTPVAKLAEPVTRPVVDTVAPAVGELTGTGLLAPVIADVVSVAQPIVDAVRPTLDPVLDATRPAVGPLVDVVIPPVAPAAITSKPDLEAHDATSPVANPRPVPTPGQALAPPAVHQSSDLRGPGRPPAHRRAGGRPGDGTVGTGDLTPIDANASESRPPGSTTSADGSGAAGGAVADASARPWAPEPGAQASHCPPDGKLTGRWPTPGAAPV